MGGDGGVGGGGRGGRGGLGGGDANSGYAGHCSMDRDGWEDSAHEQNIQLCALHAGWLAGRSARASQPATRETRNEVLTPRKPA